MRVARAQLLTAGALLALAGGAVANEASVADAVGDQIGPMSFDVEFAAHGHSSQTAQYPRFLSHAVTSAEAVTEATLHEEEVQLRFNFDVKGDKDFERSVVVDYDTADVRSDMWRGGYPFAPAGLYEPPDWVGFVEVSRPDDRTLQVTFPRRLLGRAVESAGSYRWMVEVYRLPGWNSWCAEGDVSPCYDRTEATRHRL